LPRTIQLEEKQAAGNRGEIVDATRLLEALEGLEYESARRGRSSGGRPSILDEFDDVFADELV
jgi:hypothetical protein